MTRPVSPRLAECELTFRDREPIDMDLAVAQHDAYERKLEALGCRIVHLEHTPQLPDGVFVEDAAIVLDEVAIITRPGAPSRRAETDSVARALQRYRAVRGVDAPATLDGGDVLRVDHRLFVGHSQRTNNRGIAQLRDVAGSAAYHVIPTPMRGCLHLKSAVSHLGNGAVLINPDWVDAELFDGLEPITVHPTEPFAANVLHVDGTVLVSASCPRTQELLESRGFKCEAIDVSELEKAEAGLTCCSLIFSS